MAYLYRVFDANDRLLYVGQTNDPFVRLRNHAGKAWFAKAARITLAGPMSKAKAKEDERHAIKTEYPLINHTPQAARLRSSQRFDGGHDAARLLYEAFCAR